MIIGSTRRPNTKPPSPNSWNIRLSTSPPNTNAMPWLPMSSTRLTPLAAAASAARPGGTNSTSAPIASCVHSAATIVRPRTARRLFDSRYATSSRNSMPNRLRRIST